MAWLRFPTVRDGTVVFVCDDDLWSAPLAGGEARRLTTSRAPVSWPRIRPDGAEIAFVGSDEGVADAWVVDARGGAPRRITWEGEVSGISGWTDDGAVIVASAAGQPFFRPSFLHEVPADGRPARRLPYGPAQAMARGPGGAVVLCRHADDLARWKRYKGGRVGALWIDRDGSGEFAPLVQTGGNVAAPLWVGDRVWFLSDHEGTGNLYSVLADGTDLRAHTDHRQFFARHPSTDGAVVVYARAGELWRTGPDAAPERIEVDVRPGADHSRRRFVAANKYRTGQDLHPDGHALALEVRGRPFAMAHWEGAVTQLGQRDGVRYRLVRWLPDGRAIACASDAGGEEGVEVHPIDGSAPRRYDSPAFGRLTDLAVSPDGARIAFANHRQQAGVLTCASGEVVLLDTAPSGPIGGLDWSADSRWLAWSRPESAGATSRICVWSAADGGVTEITDGRYADWSPSWDPDGALLYFLSRRDFDPVYDAQFFDLNFPRGSRPWAVTLRADAPHPFRATARPLEHKPPARRKEPAEVRIDLDGIGDRIVPMPIKESLYQRVVALPGGNLLISRKAPVGALDRTWYDPGPPRADTVLALWDAERRELVPLDEAITDFGVDLHRKNAWISTGWQLRVLPANPDKGRREELKKHHGTPPGRRSGWVDLARIRCAVLPRLEWQQMFHETWRLMRDHYWTAGLAGVDWEGCRDRYAPLVERVSTREELSDLLWTLQGELGTSHAYEMGGDLRHPPRYAPGRLAADFAWDDGAAGWRITRICRGDAGLRTRTSPLAEPGIQAREGEILRAIGGVALDATRPPAAELVHQADQLVSLRIEAADGAEREVVVRALRDDRVARYRDHVRRLREAVHARTGGRCGYVHIPDMGPGGYADFHRDYLVESHRGALVVDVRHNRGGHVSQLLLEKLARRPIAWTVARWSEPSAYPRHAVGGPMICLTNEYAGSDGDIFSHNWKQLGLGPLVGRRTWGGVVGIWPRHWLVDRSVTTQPEFAFWFPDVGWAVENHGTVPDVDVENKPQDWAAGRDAQLDTALAWMLEALEGAAPRLPEFGPGPDLSA